MNQLKAKLEHKGLNQVLHGTNWLYHLPENVDHDNLFYILINQTKVYPSYLFKNNETYPEMKKILGLFENRSSMSIASWFESTSSFLNGKSPKEVMGYDIALVVLAVEDFVTPNNFG